MISIAKNSHWLQTLAARLIAAVNPAIDHNVAKIAGLKKALYFVNLEGVPGDYVEFGMYEGTSFIGAFECHMRTRRDETPDRAFWGFDSFDGFKYSSNADAHPFFREGDFKSSYEKTRRRIEKHFKRRAKWTITPGYVEDTIGGRTAGDIGIGRVAVAFIDLDLGAPARVALEFLAPALHPGSVIILDDYFAYRGSETHGVAGAFKDFRAAHPRFAFRRLFDYGHGGQAFVLADGSGDSAAS